MIWGNTVVTQSYTWWSLTGLNASNDSGIIIIPTMPKEVPMLCRENPNPPVWNAWDVYNYYTHQYVLVNKFVHTYKHVQKYIVFCVEGSKTKSVLYFPYSCKGAV